MIDKTLIETYLDSTYKKYQQDIAFAYLRSTAKSFVPGEGPLGAAVMLVGEAPGPEEDDAGRPFVGPSGEILNTLLKSAGLDRKAVFITNTVKYRTVNTIGNNRHPTRQEVIDSLPCLKTEVVTVNPKVLALMGKSAIQAFFPMHKPQADHGMIYQHTPTSRPVVLLYHPGLVIYEKSMMQTLIDDFNQINVALREQSGGDDS